MGQFSSAAVLSFIFCTGAVSARLESGVVIQIFSKYYVSNTLLIIMDPGHENSSGPLLSSAKFKSINAVSIKGEHPEEIVQCILEHEANGTPLVLTGLNSCSSWPSVIPHLLGRGDLTAEGLDSTKPLRGQGLTS